jgi:hypothetical protein
MRRREFTVLAIGTALLRLTAAGAQQGGKLYRIAFINAGSASALGGLGFERSFIEAFREFNSQLSSSLSSISALPRR